MTSKRLSFTSHADHVAALQPWIASPLRTYFHRGVFLGPQLGTGRPVFLDPAWLRGKGFTHSPSFGVRAAINHGKTGLVKSLAHRLPLLQSGVDEDGNQREQPTVRINDRDLEGRSGEYVPLGELVDARTVRLADQFRLNFLASSMTFGRSGGGEADMLGLAAMVARHAKGHELDVWESTALQAAVSRMVAHNIPFVPEALASIAGSLSRVDAQLIHNTRNERLKALCLERFEDTPELGDLLQQASHLADDPELLRRLRTAGVQVTSYLDLLMGGEYGEMFGGETDPYDLLTDPFTILDWNGVNPKTALLLLKLFNHWVNLGSRLGDRTVTPSYMFSEEEGTALSDPNYAELRADVSRKARKRPTIDVSVAQYVTDTLTLGDAGSSLRHWGEVIHNGTGMWLIGGQPPSTTIINTLTGMGFSELDAYTTCVLPPQCWALYIPNGPLVFFQHTALPSQQDLVLSARGSVRAAVRTPASIHEDVVRRRAELLRMSEEQRNDLAQTAMTNN